MCDRVAILREGKVVVSGALRQLLRGEVLGTEIALAAASDALCAELAAEGFTVSRGPTCSLVEIEGEARVGEVLKDALAAGAQVIEVVPKRETLEDLFLRRAIYALPVAGSEDCFSSAVVQKKNPPDGSRMSLRRGAMKRRFPL